MDIFRRQRGSGVCAARPRRGEPRKVDPPGENRICGDDSLSWHRNDQLCLMNFPLAWPVNELYTVSRYASSEMKSPAYFFHGPRIFACFI